MTRRRTDRDPRFAAAIARAERRDLGEDPIAIGSVVLYRFQSRELEGEVCVTMPDAIALYPRKLVAGKVRRGRSRWIRRDAIVRVVG